LVSYLRRQKTAKPSVGLQMSHKTAVSTRDMGL
jgi:hypothetical protein